MEQWRQLEEMEVESRDPRYPGLGCIVDLLLDTNIQVVDICKVIGGAVCLTVIFFVLIYGNRILMVQNLATMK